MEIWSSLTMECLGPRCAAMILEWLKEQSAGTSEEARQAERAVAQRTFWTSVAYDEESPAIRTAAELEGALEHLEFAVFRRYQNQLTRAERSRIDNTIQNARFKIDRYLERHGDAQRTESQTRYQAICTTVREAREKAERLQRLARRADLKLAQLDALNAEQFEEFVAELFEALGYEVERVGGTGDLGADLRASKHGLRCVVQCKYHSQGVIGSPDLQKFLGTLHHNGSHKGFFVTTRTFSLAAERFAALHPIELVDGPRLVELVHEALGPAAHRAREPALF
jgi:restriction system protein